MPSDSADKEDDIEEDELDGAGEDEVDWVSKDGTERNESSEVTSPGMGSFSWYSNHDCLNIKD